MYVEMRDICKNYGNFRASDHVSFGIEKGKLVALLGPSGSGKTTLLRMIAGLETPNSGDIYIDGQRVNDVPAAKRGIGFVFQNYALFRYMTVYDNVAFGLELAKVPKKEIKKRVTELLELTGLSGMESVIRTSCPVGSVSEWHLPAHWHRIRRYFFSMSRLRQSMQKSAPNFATGFARWL